MRLILHSQSAKVAIGAGVAATIAGADVQVESSPQDFGSRLFREPDALGLLYLERWRDVVATVHALRIGDVRNILFALTDGPGMAREVAAKAGILYAGADDAQFWPLDPREVAARLGALVRRTRRADTLTEILPGVVFDPENQSIVGDGLSIHLTGYETRLLEALASRPGACVTKSSCMLAIYAGRDEPHSKIIDVYIHKLRRKMEPLCDGRRAIETVWGQGYRLGPGRGGAA